MRVRRGHRRAPGLAPATCLLLGLALAAGGPAGAPALASASPPQQVVRVPTPGSTSELTSVSCVAASRCWAVGDYQAKHAQHGEILRWNGRGWQRVTTPEPGLDSGLAAVSCPSPRRCLAVGTTRKARGKPAHAEVLRWDGGRWQVTRAPARLIALSALSCSSAAACWALDSAEKKAVRWNGHSWGKPVHFSGLADPSAVTCVTSADCWVAGLVVKPDSIDLFNLVLHWNGRAWTQLKVPQPTDANQLGAVACAARDDCWAAGSQDTPSGRSKNEVLHWNGRRWSLTAVPKGPLVNSELLAATCRARTDCWAVGDDEGGLESLHWGGHRWVLVPTPAPRTAGFLYGVSCAGRADCLAAGITGVPPVQAHAVHWNGARWKAV